MKILKLLLPVLILITSCYTTKEKTLISKVKYPGSEQKINGKYYLVKETEKAGIENPYETVELSEASKYKYRTTEKYSQKKEKNGGVVFLSGTLFSVGAGAICANNTQWFTNTNKSQAFLAGVTLGAFTWWLLSAILPKNISADIEKPGIEYDYKTDKLLANTEIQIKANQLDKKFQTDSKGTLKFSPLYDFELNNLKTNDTIHFNFKKENLEFNNSIKLQPSDWMKQYARIKVPKTPLTNSLDENIGYAREGMLYQVIGQDKDLINIKAGSKLAWINAQNADVYYTKDTKTDLTPAIKSFVVDEMQKWMQQGEFELPEEYLNRIAHRDEQLQIFTNEAMKTFQKEYIEMFDWNNSTISNYDPNSQTFKISIPSLKEIIVNVPINNAKEFKRNWKTNVFKNQEFTMIDGKWELVSLQIEDPLQSYTATFSTDLNQNYDPVNQFAFDFKDFEPDLSKFQVNQKNLQQHETPDKEKYAINTNLPKTGMQQPDAIAVVIGNALYQKTEPVNYAINDAQLMKLYLTEVLGFKEGNIIFSINASKAEIEGLFGTDENHKGKLYNYIKEGISDVFIFYSGHGAPDPQTAEPYLVPTDCDPSYLNLQGYALKTLYRNLAKLPSKSTTVIIDACFSGAGVLKNISSVRIKPKDTECDIPNSTVITSSAGDQVSSWYNEMKHGLFTYFFLKSIHDNQLSDKNGDKQLTFNEIYDYISDKTSGVPYFARRLNAVEQTPVIKGSAPDRVFIKF
jgi:hypothetical protein